MKRLLALIVAVLVVSGLRAQQKADFSNVTVKDLSGKEVSVAGLSKDGNPVMLVFWSTWCKSVCYKMLDELNDHYKSWREKTGVKIYAIAIDDMRTADKVLPAVNGKDWDFEMLLDDKGELKRAVKVSAPPYLCLLNGKGKVVSRHAYSDDVVDILHNELLFIKFNQQYNE